MADRELIITLPNSHLRTKSRRVGVVDERLHKVIENMKSATLDWEKNRPHEVGVALAAIQIDQPYKIIIIRDNPDDKKDKSFTVLLNPKITKLEGKISEDFEGCLSVADIYGKVARYEKVRVSALNERGQPIRLRAEGFLARVLQHEIDHINGVVFPDRIKNLSGNIYRLNKSGELEKIDDQSIDFLRQ